MHKYFSNIINFISVFMVWAKPNFLMLNDILCYSSKLITILDSYSRGDGNVKLDSNKDIVFGHWVIHYNICLFFFALILFIKI